MGKGVAVVVGGSVAGLACTHVVVEAVVQEKAPSPAARGGTGTRLGLETVACWIPGWGSDAAAHRRLDRATDGETKAARTLTRDESFNFRAAHLGDLHRRLHEALPDAVTELWGHQLLSFDVSGADEKRRVVATARVLRTMSA